MPPVKRTYQIDFKSDMKIVIKEQHRKMQKGIYSWRRPQVNSRRVRMKRISREPSSILSTRDVVIHTHKRRILVLGKVDTRR
jgi:hypothetical protein